MSSHEPRQRRLLDGVYVRLGVFAARFLITLPPQRLGRVIGFVHKGARRPTKLFAQQARDRVCEVSVRCTGQGCLQRSVAVIVYSRFYGYAPDWCAGFALEPFTAHAWVEVEGEPIGEPPKVSDYIVAHSVRLPANPRLAHQKTAS